MGRVFKIIVVCVAFLLGTGVSSIVCYGADTSDIIDDIDFSDTESSQSLTGIDFEKLVKEITQGEFDSGMDFVSIAKDTLLWQLKSNQKGFMHILILAVISAVFTNFARSFKSETISETGIFVSLLAIIALLFSCFYLSESIADEAIDNSMTFMKGAMPVMAMAIAVSGAGGSALAVNELVLGLITLVYWILQVGVLKIANIYVAFSMINSLSKDKSLGRMCKLCNMAGSWLVKTAIGIVVGVGTIQSLILPVSDSLKTNVLSKALSAIPGIGNGVSAVSSTIVGASCLVKNSIGVAAFIVVVAICIVPVLKLAIFVLMYKILAAVLEPICDSRITSCINDVSTAIKIQLSAVAACAGLFMISIAIICHTTNVSYLAG